MLSPSSDRATLPRGIGVEACASGATRPRSPFVDRPFTPNPDPADALLSLDTLPQEYPAFGNTDFRSPAYQVLQEDGSTVTDFAYRSYRIFPGKPAPLAGLPSTYVEGDAEADTLEITLADELIGLEVVLSYTVFAASTRSPARPSSGTGGEALSPSCAP
jgi:alpha-galactosidase